MNLGQNDVVELLQEGVFKLKLMTPQVKKKSNEIPHLINLAKLREEKKLSGGMCFFLYQRGGTDADLFYAQLLVKVYN
jgi:hypothetical protein